MYVQVQPLSWPTHTHRQVLNDALDSPVTEAELTAAAATVAAEAARLGRFSSFSDRRLMRSQGLDAGLEAGSQHVGSRTAATSAQGAQAAVDDNAEISGSEPVSKKQQVAQTTHDRDTAAAPGQLSPEPGCSPSASFSQLEAGLYDLDLDMIMPAVQSEECSE